MSQPFTKCLVCNKRLVWIDEFKSYIPSANCERSNCPYMDDVDDLEADEEINYDPENYQES